MAQSKIRVRLKSYDSTIIDAAAQKVVEAAKRNGSKVSGPIPLPTDKEIITSPYVDAGVHHGFDRKRGDS